MRAHDDASEGEMLRAIAATRLVLGPRMSVQAPPNLTPKTYGRYLDAGINDWGGVSPVTPDHVNPEMPWPRIDELADVCEQRGFALRQRLPLYPHYVTDEHAFVRYVAPSMRRHVLAAADGMGLAREERWYAGEGWTPILRAAQPAPKRRAIALQVNKPAQQADEVSQQFASHVREGAYGAPPALGLVGFDEMLPDIPGRTVLPWERADLAPNATTRHDWVAPYFGRTTQASGTVASILAKAHQGDRLDHDEVVRLLPRGRCGPRGGLLDGRRHPSRDERRRRDVRRQPQHHVHELLPHGMQLLRVRAPTRTRRRLLLRAGRGRAQSSRGVGARRDRGLHPGRHPSAQHRRDLPARSRPR